MDFAAKKSQNVSASRGSGNAGKWQTGMTAPRGAQIVRPQKNKTARPSHRGPKRAAEFENKKSLTLVRRRSRVARLKVAGPVDQA